MAAWQPREIVIHEAVRDDPVRQRILSRCPDVPSRQGTLPVALRDAVNAGILSPLKLSRLPLPVWTAKKELGYIPRTHYASSWPQRGFYQAAKL